MIHVALYHMLSQVIDPGQETEYESVEEICYCSGTKDR